MFLHIEDETEIYKMYIFRIVTDFIRQSIYKTT